MLTTDQIREKFLKFMESHGHKRLPSDNLVPQNDPTLLFTGAGMNQFKPQFKGIGIEFPRVTTSQKCLRTGDIDNVGKTPRHHTFFEMLGYFSFGDYFKEEAIPLCWNFLTQEMNLNPSDLWVTIYKDDDEAHAIWKKIVPENKIIRLGEKENFWPSQAPSKGPNGPCGPCSEVHLDCGEEIAPHETQPGGSSDRFLEICNIVFTQYDRKEGGELAPLPQKNIDFGMGLERLVAVVQGVKSNFEIDIFKKLQEFLVSELNLDEALDQKFMSRLRRVMDHMRTLVFCIAEGVQPGPNAQGYVIRRLLRRAILDIHDLGCEKLFLHCFVTPVIDVMKNAYPDLRKESQKIEAVVKVEEENFHKTLRSGRNLLDQHVAQLKSSKNKTLEGSIAFELYNTYGFPLELTQELLQAEGFEVDQEGYQKAAKQNQELSKKGSKISEDVFVESPAHIARKFVEPTQFTGYSNLVETTTAAVLFNQKEKVTSLSKGEQGFVVTPVTPFYAESGGQLGDRGLISGPNFEAQVLDTQKEADIWLHRIKVTSGKIETGSEVTLKVDQEWRTATVSNHSATHLMHWALREVLGDQVAQAGSQVGPETLRFDFSHHAVVTPEQIKKIEDLVNFHVWQSTQTNCEQMGIEQARASGAIAMFGEKYGKEVRVLTIGPSKELCGGTHVTHTGEIGLFKIVGQEAVGSGIRRLVGVSRQGAVDWYRQQLEFLDSTSGVLKTQAQQLPQKINRLLEESQAMKKELDSFRQAQGAAFANQILAQAKEVAGLQVICTQLPEGQDVMQVHDKLKGKVDANFLVSVAGQKASFLVGLSDSAISRGFKAGDLVKKVSSFIEGKGGGQPHLARGSGTKIAGISAAFEAFNEILQRSG